MTNTSVYEDAGTSNARFPICSKVQYLPSLQISAFRDCGTVNPFQTGSYRYLTLTISSCKAIYDSSIYSIHAQKEAVQCFCYRRFRNIGTNNGSRILLLLICQVRKQCFDTFPVYELFKDSWLVRDWNEATSTQHLSIDYQKNCTRSYYLHLSRLASKVRREHKWMYWMPLS